MPSSSTPFLWTVLGLLIAAILGFCFNLVLNRVGKRVDRRQDWYDTVDRDRQQLLQQLQLMGQQLQQMQTQAHEMQQTVNDVSRLLVRMEIAENKIGIWWRYVEDQIPDMLRPPRPYSGP